MPLSSIQAAVTAREEHLERTVGILLYTRDLHNLRKGQLKAGRTDRAGGLSVQELQLRLPFENQLVSNDLGLAAAEVHPALQELFHRGFGPREVQVVRKCKGFFLHSYDQTSGLGLAKLLNAGGAFTLHPVAEAGGPGGEYLDLYGQTHSGEDFSGVQTAGIRRLDPGDGHQPTAAPQAGVFCGAGKSDTDGHPPEPFGAIGDVEDGAPGGSGHLDPPLLGFFALETYHRFGIHDAQDIRAGVGDNALQGLLLIQGGVQNGIVTVEMGGLTFQLHSVPLLVLILQGAYVQGLAAMTSFHFFSAVQTALSKCRTGTSGNVLRRSSTKTPPSDVVWYRYTSIRGRRRCVCKSIWQYVYGFVTRSQSLISLACS